MTSRHPFGPITLITAVLCCAGLAPTTVVAQNTPGTIGAQEKDTERVNRLRKEQQEILRKTERLQALMERLRQRYEREGKREQVDLLTAGLEHLKDADVLRDVASIREDLSSTALSEAVRKQRKVVANLEKLLNILLDRRSVESIAQMEQLAAKRAASARQLEQRQRDLQQRTDEALQREPTPGAQALLDQLRDLTTAERTEADRNNRESGQRLPFIEAALERIEQLQRQNERLDKALAEEDGSSQSTRHQRQFDLGELIQQTRDLARHVRGQSRQDELEKSAEALAKQAKGTDAQALEQARNRFEALVNDAPKIPGTSEGERTDPKWREVAESLETAPRGETEAEREELGKLAQSGSELAKQRSDESKQRNIDSSEQIASSARSLAEQLADDNGEPNSDPNGEPGSDDQSAPQKALKQAAESLDKARDAAKEGKPTAAQKFVDQALSSLEKARRQHARENPDAEDQAAKMAAESASTAQELANAPNAEAAERDAAEQMQQAADALRGIESEVGESRQESRKPDTGSEAETTKKSLQEAKETLQKALDEATADRGQDLEEAAERQQEISEKARETAEALQQAVENGDLTQQQAEQASQSIKQARQAMKRAAQQLSKGQQSSAAQQQQQAAEALADASEQMQQNQPVTQDQKDHMAAQAESQKQLAEDIVRLAKELDQREQSAARRKLDEAADAAKKAEEALENGDAEETQEKQEEARQKLEEAAKELEEERDRYQDLRQEELLFKMKEELLAFLERQAPITQQTLEAQKAAERGRLSRPVRRKLSQLGEEELELAGRIDFLVTALADEGNMVYQTVLRANLEDLHEISTRLSGRSPDPGTFTTLMQQDVERRTEQLLEALERDRKRREQERKEQQQQQQQQQQGENKFNPQRQRLVSLIAELEMLKSLLEDTGKSTDNMNVLISARSDESLTESEGALIERLAHRHSEITKLFLQIKAAIEETMQQMQGQEGSDEGNGR